MSADGERIETEIKIAVGSAGDAATLLMSHRFEVIAPRILESNAVYDTLDAALRAQECLLRIRRAAACVVTFKGPAVRGRHKSRPELETTVSDAVIAGSILNHLGFHEVFRYEKYRTEFARRGEPGFITIDETPIGDFLEFEGTPEWIDATARELGFIETEYLTVSYGTLYRRHCEVHGLEPSHMVFSPAHKPSR